VTLEDLVVAVFASTATRMRHRTRRRVHLSPHSRSSSSARLGPPRLAAS